MQSLIQFSKKFCRYWPNIAHEYGQRGEKELMLYVCYKMG